MGHLSFRARRRIAISLTIVALAIVGGCVWIQSNRLAHASFFTGGLVLGCILLLALFGARRRIPILPVGSVSTWTQIHIYTGLFAAGVYWMHVPSLIGNGVFECGLSLVFLTVTLSGFYGLYVSRTLPKRLTAVEGQHRFDRVQWHRNQIAEHARRLLDDLSDHAEMTMLGTYYRKHLSPFFGSRPSLGYVLIPTGGRRRKLLGGLRDLDRYLETDDRDASGRFAALVRRRDDLDYHFALQLRLRLWVVVHSIFSLALVIGGIIHAFMAFRFAA